MPALKKSSAYSLKNGLKRSKSMPSITSGHISYRQRKRQYWNTVWKYRIFLYQKRLAEHFPKQRKINENTPENGEIRIHRYIFGSRFIYVEEKYTTGFGWEVIFPFF